MTILEMCRNKAFWIMDALRGGQVRKAYELIEKCDKGIWSEEEIDAYQQNCIEKLLRHCMNTVPFYNSLKSIDLHDWPVVNKATYKCDYERHLSSCYDRNKLIRMSTSGSTGTPFTCYQDKGKKRHVNAEVLYYNGQTGYKIGRRIIYLRSVVSEIAKSDISQFFQNIYLLNCTDLSDKGIAEKIDFIRRYSKSCGAMLMGYSSTLDAFRKYFERNGYHRAEGCNIYGVVGGSTMLYDNTRDSMEKAFGCKCYSRYANEENGFLGQDGVENNVFFVNNADYFVEILKLESNEPAEFGEIGRIVVTDLYNYAMPMVRYDTGDVGAWVEITRDCTKKRAIGSFGGRIVDMIYNCYGESISPHSISTSMWKYKCLEQYQFAQTGKKSYEIRINLKEPNMTVDETDLINTLKVIVGRDAEIELKYRTEIPVLSSGKRRYIINEMKR